MCSTLCHIVLQCVACVANYSFLHVAYFMATLEFCSVLQWHSSSGLQFAGLQCDELQETLDMGWLRLVGSIKLKVSFAEYSLFYSAFLIKETIFCKSDLFNFMDPTNRSHPIYIPPRCFNLGLRGIVLQFVQRLYYGCNVLQCAAVCWSAIQKIPLAK